jgi:hypothetical protein
MRLTAWATWLLGVGLVGWGCAGRKDPGAEGEDCYRDDDCKSGLVCVANMSGARVCSKDVTSLVGMVEGPPPEEPPPEEPPPEEPPPEEPPPETVDDAGAQ